MLWTDFLEREALTQGDPETFLVTPHYEEWPLVLIRLARVDEREPGGAPDRVLARAGAEAPPPGLRRGSDKPEAEFP